MSDGSPHNFQKKIKIWRERERERERERRERYRFEKENQYRNKRDLCIVRIERVSS